ncbi:MAG: hydroxyisourate hydrolase [Bacteroidetes bacterium]|nr:hydroxyisourate hydrolase [Bacteroidota bacterium]
MSQLTTHILDTSIGKPAQGVSVTLEFYNSGIWKKIAEGVTNADGRITDLLVTGNPMQTGIYRLNFDSAAYFKAQDKKTFYPHVSIEFEISDGSHYHVPLLLNPFGYSTYRGS